MQRGFRIEGGSAARSAEERAHEPGAVPRGQFQGSMGIRLSSGMGQKFELPERPESSPLPGQSKPEPVAPVAATSPNAPAAAPAAAGLWNKFRGWFGRG